MTAAAVVPVPGPHDPVDATPPRRPGSVRRTSTIDTSRPDGRGGPIVVDARARDLVTAESSADRIDEVAVRLVLDPGSRVVEVRADPPVPGIEALAGASVGSGFRRAAVAALPDHHRARSLVHLLLDDLPGAVLVSGYALLRRQPIAHVRAAGGGRGMQRDLCAGWATDGTMMRAADATGFVPTPKGPPAPVLEPDGDRLAWHAMAPLPVDGMRRRRRLDVLGSSVDVHFRDSHMGDGGETVLHEYVVAATVDAGARRLVDVEAGARVLPWVECPGAVASASALRGARLGDLAALVRRDLVGTSSCTHLNDTLRSLADVDALVDLVGDPDRPAPG